MTHRLSSPPLIKGIDGIVSRSPNEVNYFTLNEKRMESGKQPENEIIQKYRKFGISDIRYVKQANTGKNGNVVEPGKENKAEMMKKDVESDGDEDGVTREAQ